jgi:hypothetical protein
LPCPAGLGVRPAPILNPIPPTAVPNIRAFINEMSKNPCLVFDQIDRSSRKSLTRRNCILRRKDMRHA